MEQTNKYKKKDINTGDSFLLHLSSTFFEFSLSLLLECGFASDYLLTQPLKQNYTVCSCACLRMSRLSFSLRLFAVFIHVADCVPTVDI